MEPKSGTAADEPDLLPVGNEVDLFLRNRDRLVLGNLDPPPLTPAGDEEDREQQDQDDDDLAEGPVAKVATCASSWRVGRQRSLVG